MTIADRGDGRREHRLQEALASVLDHGNGSEDTAVKSTISIVVPGKKYSR
jgi:hypothetical protein